MPRTPETGCARSRTLAYLSQPDRWQFWPFLALVRRPPGGDEELGVVYDALRAGGLTGFSATVFFTNLFSLPERIEDFLNLPHETHDTPEELVGAGWLVD